MGRVQEEEEELTWWLYYHQIQTIKFLIQFVCLSSNQDANPQQYSHPNLNLATLLVENHLLNSNQDQQAHVATNQDTSLTNENNVVVQHLDRNLNHAAHHVENSIPDQSSNLHMNPIVQNGDEEVNRHVMVHDQQARVVSHQNTILQVEDNVVVQNYQNVGSIFDLISPGYTMPPPRPLQMTGYQRMIHPLAHHSSQPSGFTSMFMFEDLPSTPRRSPPLPPRIVQYAHPAGMHLSGLSSTPPTSLGQAEPPAFQ